jgi:hypothetical protein
MEIYVRFSKPGLLSRYSERLRGWRPGFDSRKCKIYLLSMFSRPNPGPTQPPIEWVPGAHPLGVKVRGVKVTTHLPLPRLRMVELYFHSRIRLYSLVLNPLKPILQQNFMIVCGVYVCLMILVTSIVGPARKLKGISDMTWNSTGKFVFTENLHRMGSIVISICSSRPLTISSIIWWTLLFPEH